MLIAGYPARLGSLNQPISYDRNDTSKERTWELAVEEGFPETCYNRTTQVLHRL